MVNKIDILGKKYKVIDKIPKDVPANPDDYMGLCFDDRYKLYINPKYLGEKYYTTLMHEVGHGVMYRNGLRNSGALPIEVEEIVVETMSTVNYQFFIDLLKRFERGGTYYYFRSLGGTPKRLRRL